MVLSVCIYPGLCSIGVLAGSYVHGHHSVLLINSPNVQAAQDIGRAIMERRLAASVNILPRTSTIPPCACVLLGSFPLGDYWKGEIQDASEVLMVSFLSTTRMSAGIKRGSVTRGVAVVSAGENQDLPDYVRALHPSANPEVLSFRVEDGSPPYLKWMDEAVPDD
ncbi:protein CutA homolog [Spinachia spinachia]